MCYANRWFQFNHYICRDRYLTIKKKKMIPIIVSTIKYHNKNIWTSRCNYAMNTTIVHIIIWDGVVKFKIYCCLSSFKLSERLKIQTFFFTNWRNKTGTKPYTGKQRKTLPDTPIRETITYIYDFSSEKANKITDSFNNPRIIVFDRSIEIRRAKSFHQNGPFTLFQGLDRKPLDCWSKLV